MLRLEGITKRFPGVLSLDAVDFDVAAGEVHALVGENGAGKSTLIKVIAGAYQPDAGTIEFAGERRVWAEPAGRARRRHPRHLPGARAVPRAHGRRERDASSDAPRNRLGLIDHRAMRRRAAEVLAELGIALDPRMRGQAPVGRRPADGRDRQGPDRRRQAPDPRRADRGDLGPGGRAAVRAHAPPARPRASRSSTSRTGSRRSSRSPIA